MDQDGYRGFYHGKGYLLLVAYTGRRPNAGLTLTQRRRRWPNIKPILGRHIVFSWLTLL